MIRRFQRGYLNVRHLCPASVKSRIDYFSKSCEQSLLKAIDRFANPTDDAVIVGGAYGLSTVFTAERVNSVTTFEAGEIGAKTIRRTADLHGFDGQVQVRHGLVGPAVDVWWRMNEPERLKAGDLPDCDLLILDCEGSEHFILPDLDITPETLIVEYHPDTVSIESTDLAVRKQNYDIRTTSDDDQPIRVYTKFQPGNLAREVAADD